MSDEQQMTEIPVDVRSLFGARTRQPLVALKVGEHETLMDPDKAREIGEMLYGAAAAAEMDAFLVRFFTERVGLELGEAAALLREFCEERLRQVD